MENIKNKTITKEIAFEDFTIRKLLSLYGLELNEKNSKLVRHKEGGNDFNDIYRQDRELFDLYQSFQSRNVFDGCQYIISFIGAENTKAKYVGVFEVLSKENSNKHKSKLKPYMSQYGSLFKNNKFYYKLKEIDVCEELKSRVIIEWGSAAIRFCQRQDKEIFEILPKGYVKKFTGYLDFILNFYELEEIIKNPESNREWKISLSSVAGIYLISDKKGNQYVGSAYGKNGIWGRWEQYVKTKHGDNKKLKELLKEDNEYYKNFQFTVLQILPLSLTSKEVIKYEELFKNKLGSKVFGLNS